MIIECPAKFESREEAKAPATSSAVHTTVPMIRKDATKKRWSTQWVKVSVRDLCKEDQHDLTKALTQTDSVRGRMNSLL